MIWVYSISQFGGDGVPWTASQMGRLLNWCSPRLRKAERRQQIREVLPIND
jgi:hypothetical protein